MAANTTQRKQVMALLLLAMLATEQVAAISKSTAAAGIATLAFAAHGLRDEDTRSISLHSGSQQILANKRKQESNTYNQSLMEATTGSCILPSAKDGGEGWVRFGAGKLAAIGGVPFVGVFLTARACQVAWNKKKAALQALKESRKEAALQAFREGRKAALQALKDETGDEQPEACEDDEETQDLIVLDCEVKQSNTGVGMCLLGFALSVGSTAAALCTAGASACITAPIAYGLEVATALNTCLQDSNHCGYTQYDPEVENDDNALLTEKKIGKVRKFKKWMARTCTLPGFLK